MKACASCGGGPCRWADQAERHAQASAVKAATPPVQRVAQLVGGPASGCRVRADLLDPYSSGALIIAWATPGDHLLRPHRALTYWRRDEQPEGAPVELWDYRLPADLLSSYPRCSRGNSLAVHTRPCAPGCEYPALP